jgi:Protein of unknown function (DUF664)
MQTGYEPLGTGKPTAVPVTISGDDYLYFVERAVRGMTGIVTELGDELSCIRPDLPGANTAYGLLTHCLGVMEYWGRHLVAGRGSQRERAAEFDATGTVAALAMQVDDALRQLRIDVASASSPGRRRRQPQVPAAHGGLRAPVFADRLHQRRRGRLHPILRGRQLPRGRAARATRRPALPADQR